MKVVLKGLTGPVDVLGESYNLEMPPQGAMLPDDQIAAILTHVRSSWGNHAAAVTTDQVKAIRASVADRTEPWTAKEILKQHPLPLHKTALNNLISQTYETDSKWLPNLSEMTPINVEEEHDGIISVRDSPLKDHFAMAWTADFEAPEDAIYEFVLNADDSAVLTVDGKKVANVGGSGPMNAARAKRGRITLTQGSHPFRVDYLEFSGTEGIMIGWRMNGQRDWNWLTEETSTATKARPPIVIGPEKGRPVIYRNFIDGTTPRSIGVGFPGGLNLAYSADHLAPEMIWTGAFIDGTPKWINRGTDTSPPAGEKLIKLTTAPILPDEARFKGYQLNSEGNPTFEVQIGSARLLDSWRAESGSLIRTLTLSGDGPALEIAITDQFQPDKLSISPSTGTDFYVSDDNRISLKLAPGEPTTLTYHWK